MQEKANKFASRAILGAGLLGVGFFLAIATLVSAPAGVFAQTSPSVDIKANGSDGPVTVVSGGTVNLSWTSVGTINCAASGAWGGVKPLNGSETSPSVTQTRAFNLTCVNQAGQSTFDYVTVTVLPPQLPTVDIKANSSDGPVTVDAGSQFTLSWNSTNATNCNASGGWSGSKSTSGSEQRTGVANTSFDYVITCTNSSGQSDSDVVRVTVNELPQPPTVDIKANGSNGPVAVDSGDTAFLTWTSTNATSCTASNAWSGNKSINGSENTNSITSSRTFTITCSGVDGTDSDSVTVYPNAVDEPTVDIKANSSDGPITIPYNSSAFLTWTSTNATSCTASNAWSGARALNGSETTNSLTSTRTYRITCTGPGGIDSDFVTVNVGQPDNVTVDIKANGSDGPVNIAYNTSANLTWTSNNADTCTASGSWNGSRATSGSQSTSALTFSRTYTITCSGVGGTDSDSVTVNVDQPGNVSVDIKANSSDGPISIGYNSSANLSWTSTNATSCTTSNAWSGSRNTSGSESTSNLTQSRTYTITCSNNFGQSDSDSVTVNVGTQSNLPTLNFYANPTLVPSGNTSTLYWNTTNADYCTASGDWSGSKAVNGSEVTQPIFVTRNYILTCYGQGGSVVRNTTVSPQGQVLGTVPPTLTIYAIPVPVAYGAGSNVYWSAANVDFCNASGDWFGSKPLNGQQATGPLFGSRTYTMTCYGQGGSITRSAVVPVIPPTPIYVPPTCPVGGCVQGVTGSYSATIDKTIENLSLPGVIGSQVTARPGNELRYTITVRNTGTLILTNLTVRDILSDKVELRTASDNGAYDYTNRTVTWKIARLGAGETKTITLTVRVIQCDIDVVIENRAYLTGKQISEVSSNNTVAGVTTGPFSVSIDNPSPVVAPGDKVTYTIRYRNDAPSVVRGATLDVYIPSGMIIEGYSQTCTVTGNTVRLVIGDVAPGQSGEVRVIGLVDKGVLDGEQLVTRAVVTYQDAAGVTRESSATTVSVVDRDGVATSNDDAEFAAAANEGTSRGLSFLPDTFFGWLLLLLLVIVLAVFVKRLLSKE